MKSKITAENISKLESFTREVMERDKAVGLAIAAIDDRGNTLYQQFFGVRDKEKNLPIDENTLFGLASVSKSFAALGAVQLAEKNVIDLHTPVCNYLEHYTDPGIAATHLLSHSAGYFPQPRRLVKEIIDELKLTPETEGDYAYSEKVADYGGKYLAQRLSSETDRTGVPGESFSYSNDSFAIMGEVLRAKGGEKSLAAFVKKSILEPLDMNRSGYDYFWTGENISRLYYKEGEEVLVTDDFLHNSSMIQGGGGMKSTIADMKKYVSMYLNHGKGLNGTRIVSQPGVAEMARPRISCGLNEYYGYGLEIKPLDDLTVIEHGGAMTGISSNMAWSWEAGAGVIVLCNTSGVDVADISMGAMRMLNGKDPLPKEEGHSPVAWEEARLEAAAGTYLSGEAGEVTLTRKGEGFVLGMSGLELPAYPINRYMLEADFNGRKMTVMVNFDEDGSVKSMNASLRLIPKIK